MNTEFIKGTPLFTKINDRKKQYKYLTEDISTDVIIVGGGVTGAILSYYFTKNNINVVLLDKNRIAHGSTSIVTALLEYELNSNAMALSKNLKLDDIMRAYKLCHKALDEIQDIVDEYGNNCDYKRVDSLLYTSKKLEIKEIEEEFKIRKQYGFDVELIDKNNNNYGFDIKAGILGKNGGIKLDPYKFTHQILDISCSKGLKVYENSEVVDVEYFEDKVIAKTIYDFKVTGKIIIVATGYNTELFSKRTFGTKSTTYNIATKPIKNLDKIYDTIVARDNETTYNYLRTTKDNRIIIGGEDESFNQGINDEKLSDKKYSILEQRLKNMFKNLDIEIEYKYCGVFGSTKDELGFIGKDPSNERLWYSLGYGANGIIFNILGGMMLSKLYLGEEDENMNLFKVNRFD